MDSDFDADLEEEMEKNIAQSPPPEDIKQRIQSSDSTVSTHFNNNLKIQNLTFF